MLYLHCYEDFSVVWGAGATLSSFHVWTSHCGDFSCCEAWALGHMGSLVMVPSLYSTRSIVAGHGFSCSVACGIFPDRGSSPCILH